MYDLATVVRSLRRHLRKQSRASLAAFMTGVAASSVLLRYLRLKALANAHRIAPVSELLKQVESGHVRGAVERGLHGTSKIR